MPPPWVLKPRSSAAAIGIKKVGDRDELWRALDAAGDERSNCVLEQFVRGDVYHVDSIVWNGQVVFAVPFKYGRPPMEIAHQGGLFITRRLPDDSRRSARRCSTPTAGCRTGLGLHTRRVAHRVHPRRRRSASLVFLETSARVGGAFIVDTIEAATGINLWREWAKVEIAGERRRLRPCRRIAQRLRRHRAVAGASGRSRTCRAYTDPEIVTTIRKDHHAGLIVRSPDPQRVEALIDDYTQRFYRDFFATAPPPERPVE